MKRSLRNQGQGGFVLVFTLWVMVIVVIAASYFSDKVAGAVDMAQRSRQNSQAVIDISATRAELLYRLGTTSMTFDGLGGGTSAIALDNRYYRGLGNTMIRLQDNRGLLNLNVSEDDRLQRLLGFLGIAAGQRSRLIDTLRDYTDPDNLHRLNGAEQDEYIAQKLQPPSNSNLITPWEARRIIGWRDSPQLWENGRLVELTTTSQTMGLNPNTAPAEVLATLPGVTQDLAKVIIARRKAASIMSVEQLAVMTALPVQLLADDVALLPSNSIRITQLLQGRAYAVQYNITLTPQDENAPWKTDFYSRVSVNRQTETPAMLQAIPELPPRSFAAPVLAPD